MPFCVNCGNFSSSSLCPHCGSQVRQLSKTQSRAMRNVLIVVGIFGLLAVLGQLSERFSLERPSQTDIPAAGNQALVERPNQEPVTSDAGSAPPVNTPSYKIVHVLQNARFDHAPQLYVFTSAPNSSPASFNHDMKNIIQKIVQGQGPKISIEIYDNKEVLERKYQIDASPGTAPIADRPQLESDGLHHLAGFSGELTTGPYLNTLYLFPGAFKQTAGVGKYVDILEFDPR